MGGADCVGQTFLSVHYVCVHSVGQAFLSVLDLRQAGMPVLL
jgi:hypothetical protein